MRVEIDRERHFDYAGLPFANVKPHSERTGGWRVEKHPRVMADVNDDGIADIVGFGMKVASRWTPNYGSLLGIPQPSRNVSV